MPQIIHANLLLMYSYMLLTFCYICALLVLLYTLYIICMYVCMRMYVHMYVCMYVSMYAYVYVCMCVYVCIYINSDLLVVSTFADCTAFIADDG